MPASGAVWATARADFQALVSAPPGRFPKEPTRRLRAYAHRTARRLLGRMHVVSVSPDDIASGVMTRILERCRNRTQAVPQHPHAYVSSAVRNAITDELAHGPAALDECDVPAPGSRASNEVLRCFLDWIDKDRQQRIEVLWPLLSSFTVSDAVSAIKSRLALGDKDLRQLFLPLAGCLYRCAGLLPDGASFKGKWNRTRKNPMYMRVIYVSLHAIDHHGQSEFMNRRRHTRFSLREDELAFAGLGSSGTAVEISHGGAVLSSRSQLTLGRTGNIQLELAKRSVDPQMPARILRRHGDSNRYSVQFLAALPHDLASWVSGLEER